MKKMRIPALEWVQNNQRMFVFLGKAQLIYEKFDVSRRIDDKEHGYQRSFSTRRINQIKSYVKKSGIIPNSILVNLDVGKYYYDETTRELVLNDENAIGFIIDGQHRVKGSYEADSNLLLPVVATVDLDTKNQAQLFVTINDTQAKVPVSLYLDLLDIIEGVIEDFDDETISAERRAREIAIRLNEDEESPFFDLVRRTGDRGRGISLEEFVRLLKEYVTPKNGKLLNYGFEEQYLIFKIYFRAIKAVFLTQWEDHNSLILKTVGFGGLMKAFFDIFTLVITQGNKEFSTNNTIEVLKLIENFKFDDKTLPGGGFKAQDNASKLIVSQIKKAMRNTEGMNIKIVE